MFHELLDQFMAAYDDEVALKTRYPRFGQRWLYAPVSTFAARRAWIVHPPEEGVRASVRNALDHLQLVRDAKRQRRLDGALRVREEAQAQLVAVQARAEVRRAKAGGARRPGGSGLDSVPHRPIAVPPQHQHQPYPLSPPPVQPSIVQQPSKVQQPSIAQQQPIAPPPPPAKGRGRAAAAAPAPRAAAEPPATVPVLDPDAKSQIAGLLDTNGRDVLGRRPLAEAPTESNGRDVIGRRPLSDQRREQTQRMIAEAMAVGEEVQPEMVMDWVQRQFGGQRPTQAWARDQILSARSRDTIGLDADLV